MGKGDLVYMEATDDFYRPHLSGWFLVTSVAADKDRFTVASAGSHNNDSYKMFRNHKGFCCVVEHEYDRFGESTWDEEKCQHRFIFVTVNMFAMCKF